MANTSSIVYGTTPNPNQHTAGRKGGRKGSNHPIINNVKKHWLLYVMALPGILYFIIFKYIPILGSFISLQDYQIFSGMWKSPWVGLKHFIFIFTYPDFYQVVRNTFIIGFYQLVIGFPAPLILAIMLNEIRIMAVKRPMQTLFYLPHFLSWPIIGGIIYELLSLNGPANMILETFGFEPQLFLQKSEYFRGIVTSSYVWKETGWNTIIFLAALAGINPSLYEAATVDGASRWRQIFSITIPCLMPTIMILFLLRVGNFLELGFEQIYVLMTPMTYAVGDILDTYVYRVGIVEGRYSLTTAVGLFKSIIGFFLLYFCNYLSKKSTGQGLY